jgi:hypothetical protein
VSGDGKVKQLAMQSFHQSRNWSPISTLPGSNSKRAVLLEHFRPGAAIAVKTDNADFATSSIDCKDMMQVSRIKLTGDDQSA